VGVAAGVGGGNKRTQNTVAHKARLFRFTTSLDATELWDEDRQRPNTTFYTTTPTTQVLGGVGWGVGLGAKGLSVLCELESPLKEGIREGENPVFGPAAA